ncbi:MAG: RDD family protein [Bacteroidota bacterium]
MSILKVQTAQNVNIYYEVGNMGFRLLTGILDLITVALYVFLAYYLINTIFQFNFFDESFNLLVFLILFIPPLLYLPVSEYFWNGRTVGKYLLKMKVVKSDGTAPSLGDYILRWLLRIVDVKLGFLMIFFVPRIPSSETEQVFIIWTMILLTIPLPIVAIVSMASSKLAQRLGDRIANTVVIKKKKLYSLDDTLLRASEDDYEPVYKNVLKLRDRDIYILKDALHNAKETHNYSYINRLATKAREILEINDNSRPLHMVETLLRDYDYLAKRQDAVNGENTAKDI